MAQASELRSHEVVSQHNLQGGAADRDRSTSHRLVRWRTFAV